MAEFTLWFRRMSKPNKHSGASWTKEGRKLVLFQVLGILVVSSVLGFAFNASNPIGIRFSNANAATAETPVAAAPVNEPAAPAPPPVIPAQPKVASTPPLPPPPTRSLPAEIPSPAGNPLVVTPTHPVPLAAAPPKPPVPVTLEALNAPDQAPQPPMHVHASPTTWVAIKTEVTAGQVVLLDARTKFAYDAGHIPGALLFPESSPPAEFEALKEKYGVTTPVVVYCSSTTCAISKRVADKLIQQYGFQSVRFMRGGYEEWQRAEVLQPKSGS
jgi:rhodanese-related sulfurtransferase